MVRRVNARELTTRRAVATELAQHGSPWVLAAATAGGLLLRRRQGGAGRADVAAVAAVVALQPLVEWGLHRHLLHLPPTTVAGLRLDPGAAHRGHHRVPDDVGGALLGTGFAVSDGLAVAAVAAVVGQVVGRLVGGRAATGTAIAAGELGLAAYEWTHLLSHSGYRPRTAWFRELRTAHLRHHFRNETANFGITSRLVDRLARTSDLPPGSTGRGDRHAIRRVL